MLCVCVYFFFNVVGIQTTVATMMNTLNDEHVFFSAEVGYYYCRCRSHKENLWFNSSGECKVHTLLYLVGELQQLLGGHVFAHFPRRGGTRRQHRFAVHDAGPGDFGRGGQSAQAFEFGGSAGFFRRCFFDFLVDSSHVLH